MYCYRSGRRNDQGGVRTTISDEIVLITSGVAFRTTSAGEWRRHAVEVRTTSCKSLVTARAVDTVARSSSPR